MPYITEELWQRLPGDKRLHAAYEEREPTVMLTAYPEGAADLIEEAAEAEMQAIIELISRVRNIRSEMNIKPSERIRSLSPRLTRIYVVFSNRHAIRLRVWYARLKFPSTIVSMRRRLRLVQCSPAALSSRCLSKG